jgi:hypothetical protein
MSRDLQVRPITRSTRTIPWAIGCDSPGRGQLVDANTGRRLVGLSAHRRNRGQQLKDSRSCRVLNTCLYLRLFANLAD